MSIHRGVSLVGVVVMLGIGFLLSRNRRGVNWRAVGWGVALQFVFAFLVLRTPPGRVFFSFMNDAVVTLLSFQRVGAEFVFNALALPPGEPGSLGVLFAFQVLTTIVFFSSLISILYHLGIMQKLVLLFAVVMKRFMGTSGAESFSASANIFVGMTEAPVSIKPYIAKMTESELMCVMTGGMATVAGGVLAAYVHMLHDSFPDIAGHLLAASVMSAPAALAVAKIMVPETGRPLTMGSVPRETEERAVNVIEAAANGATTGLHLALNVGTMLVAFLGLLALANFCVRSFFEMFQLQGITLQTLLGWAFAPLAWLMGVPWHDCAPVGQLLGEKTILNEFVAYQSLGEMLRADPGALSERSMVIASYALCGFANLGSIGILIGGLGGIAPERKQDLARLGVPSLVAGSLAAFMTATIAGVLIR